MRSLSKRLKVRKRSVRFHHFSQAFCFLLFLILLFYLGRPDQVDYSRENNVLFPQLELFLLLDPLVGVSTALATKAMTLSLVTAGIVLVICAVFPRWFCGYVCPLGTLIDLFDWSIGSRVKRYRIKSRGWWVHLRFWLLSVIFIAAIFGVLLSGFIAAIPVLTRGMVYIFVPLQEGLLKGWESVPRINGGQLISIILFAGILGLGLLRPRFWCAYLCPSGALLSMASVFNLTRRSVQDTCIECGRCVNECRFDAIAPDFSSRSLNCTFCTACKDVCPKQSIKWGSRWDIYKEKPSIQQTFIQSDYSRRTFLIGMMGAAGAGIGAAKGITLDRKNYAEFYPVRPPGSIPEPEFLKQCIRCGECLKVCPGHVLQPAAFELGIDGIWTPVIKADFAGCQPFCNNCGQVCPTGAIRKLSLDEKRAARIGLAEIDTTTCLPHCRKEQCGLCFEACAAAGYNAIEYIRVDVQYDSRGIPNPDSGYLTPVVLKEKCIGCGLCQAQCYNVNVKEKKLLMDSAVKVAAGSGKEDRLITGSYKALRKANTDSNKQRQLRDTENEYLPDFLR